MGFQILILLAVVQIVTPYSIKINPVLNTKVNNVKNTGDHNNIQLAQISNSTILVFFSLVFIILSVTITKQALVIFKLNLRISNLEQVIY